MESIPRIGKWTAKVALESALETVEDDYTIIVVCMDKEHNTMKFWAANCSNMEANWMADNVKAEVMGGAL